MGLVSLVVDSREPEEVRSLFRPFPHTVEALPAGDAMLVTDDNAILLVERKAGMDLASSIQDGRLFHQAAAMRELTPYSYLIVTESIWGDPQHGNTWIDGRARGWPWASVQGALLTVQELGLHVVQLHRPDDYARAVQRLADRKRDTLRLPPLRASTALSEQEAILGALPGVGEVHTKSLLNYCGTAAWSVAYLTMLDKPTKEAPGIGPSTRARIRHAFGLKPNEQLSIIVPQEEGPEQLPAAPFEREAVAV